MKRRETGPAAGGIPGEWWRREVITDPRDERLRRRPPPRLSLAKKFKWDKRP